MDERKKSSRGIVAAANDGGKELETFNGILRFYLVDAQDFPTAVFDYGIPVCMAYNRFFGEWRYVSVDELYKSGMEISKGEYVKALAKDGKKYPFDEKAALEFARKSYDGRFSKDVAIVHVKHSINMVKMLKSWGVSHQAVICAAYLHDVIEGIDAVESRFSCMVSDMVKQLAFRLKGEGDDDYLRRLAGNHNYHVQVIECADILCEALELVDSGRVEKAHGCLDSARCLFDAVDSRWQVSERVKEAIRREHNELLSKLEKYA